MDSCQWEFCQGFFQKKKKQFAKYIRVVAPACSTPDYLPRYICVRRKMAGLKLKCKLPPACWRKQTLVLQRRYDRRRTEKTMRVRLWILQVNLGGAVEQKVYLTNTLLKLMLMTALIWGNRSSDTLTVAGLVSWSYGPRRVLTPPPPDATKTTPLSHPTSSPQIAFTLLTPRI